MQGKREAGADSRAGMKTFTVWVKPELPFQLKILAAELGITVQALATGFLNDGLERAGKARVE